MARVLFILLVVIIAVPATAIVVNKWARWCWHEVVQEVQTEQQRLDRACPQRGPSQP